MIKKTPFNYSNDMDRRRQGLDNIVGKLNSIPDPTSDDEGKVLKVDEQGHYSLLPDGGAQTMTVTISYDSGNDEYSADKTHAQITASVASGIIVNATYDGRTYVYAGSGKESAGSPIYFSYLQADSEDQMIGKIFEIDEDERIVFSEHDIAEELPVVTSDDNGAYLEVINGVWSLNSVTLGSVIPEKNHPIIAYISGLNSNTGIYSVDYQERLNCIADKKRAINTTNLKVMVLVNNTLIAFNKNFDEVFNHSGSSRFQISKAGAITGVLNFQPTYNALIPAGTTTYSLVYIRFLSEIIIGEEF